MSVLTGPDLICVTVNNLKVMELKGTRLLFFLPSHCPSWSDFQNAPLWKSPNCLYSLYLILLWEQGAFNVVYSFLSPFPIPVSLPTLQYTTTFMFSVILLLLYFARYELFCVLVLHVAHTLRFMCSLLGVGHQIAFDAPLHSGAVTSILVLIPLWMWGLSKAYVQNCVFNFTNCSPFLSRMALQSSFPPAVMRAPTSRPGVSASLALSSSLLFAGPMALKWYPIIALSYIF